MTPETKKALQAECKKLVVLIEEGRLDEVIVKQGELFYLEHTEKEMYGAPKEILDTIGELLGKAVNPGNFDKFIAYTDAIWKTAKRDYRISLSFTLAGMSSLRPDEMIPYVFRLVETSDNWEESDNIGGYALEHLIRQEPEKYYDRFAAYLKSNNIWVIRAALVIFYRLSYKHPRLTKRVLQTVEPLLSHEDEQVFKMNKFGIGITNRADKDELVCFILKYAETDNPRIVQSLQEACWKLGKPVLPAVQEWAKSHDPKIRKTAESILKRMKG